jgi:hypothetical protein
MRHALLLSLLLVSTSVRAESKPKVDAAAIVKAAELGRFEAAVKVDLEKLGKFLADDLTYTHSTGALQTKAQLLDDLKTGKLQFKKIEPGELQIRVYGATAIINGTAKFSVVSNGEAKDINLRFTDVWVDHAGRWQLVAWQSTKLP